MSREDFTAEKDHLASCRNDFAVDAEVVVTEHYGFLLIQNIFYSSRYTFLPHINTLRRVLAILYDPTMYIADTE